MKVRKLAERIEKRALASSASIELGRVFVSNDGRLQVRIQENEYDVAVDPAVDPELVKQACARGDRVLLERGSELTIVGIVTTRRAIEIDREGNVDAAVEHFRVKSRKELLLQNGQSFLQMKGKTFEIYAGRFTARARETLRLWGRLIGLN